MSRFGLLILLFICSGCTSPNTSFKPTSTIPDRARMIFVPPVEVYEITFQKISDLETNTPETTDCIPLHQVRSTRVIEHIGIEYEMPDRKIWFNRPEWGASTLKEYLIMITRGNQNMLCSGDTVRFMGDSPGGFVGAVGLGPFVRYPESQ